MRLVRRRRGGARPRAPRRPPPGWADATYDLGVDQETCYGGPNGVAGNATLSVLADRVLPADLTVDNACPGEGRAVALLATGPGPDPENVVPHGDHVTA